MNVIVILCDTFRRDHAGPYHHGRPLNQCWSPEAPPWVVPTPNLDRLAAHGTVFDNAYSGSLPCIPARRDLYTGRYDFLERGWAPLEENDPDLPSLLSGSHPTRSIQQLLAEGRCVSYLVSDHLNLWIKGAGNYHMGFTGFEFVRGQQEDPWQTDPAAGFFCPPGEWHTKLERYWRNKAHNGYAEHEYPSARTFHRAAEWLERNHHYPNFFLHIDEFDPHEPWDPPEDLLKQFDPRGYDVEGWNAHPPYAKWHEHMNEAQFNSFRARYAAKVVLVDRQLGQLLDVMDRHNLWRNTLVIFTTDHGTYNGDHGRLGKNQTHAHDSIAHIPFIIAHPEWGRGERRSQLVQLVDIYPTVLAAMGRETPPNRHGVNLLPVLKDASAPTRDFAISGYFGSSVSITDGDWTLHQTPVPDNQPLYWYSSYLPKFQTGLNYRVGPFDGRRRPAQATPWPIPTWLADKRIDPTERHNVAGERPDQVRRLQQALKQVLIDLHAPEEQLERLGLAG